MSIMTDPTTALAGPALRLHLLELFLGNTDMPDQALPLAQAAEAWITGDEDVPDMPTHATVVDGIALHGHLLLDEEVHQAVATQIAAAFERQAEEDGAGLPGQMTAVASHVEQSTDVVSQPAVEVSDKRTGPRTWTAEEELHLERLVASGMSYADIATTLDRPIHGVYSRVSDSGINKRWPRTSRGALQYEPYPLDAPWPPPAERMEPVTPSTRKAELLALMDEGLTAREIADKLGISPSSVSARATQWRVTEKWRAARERRQAQLQASPPTTEPEVAPEIVHIDLSADVIIPVAETVELPLAVVALKPSVDVISTDDQVAAALVVDRPAFPVQTKSLAEVEATAEPPRHTAAPLAKVEPEETTRAPRRFADANTKVAKHLPADKLAEKAAERALIEAAMAEGKVEIKREVTPAYHPGGHVPLDIVITYLRNDDVVVNINKGMWLVNGAESLSAKQLLERANKRRKRHRLAPFELEK